MQRQTLLAAILVTCCPLLAVADVEFNGFASIKAGMALGSDQSLYGYDDTLSFKNESLAALQVKSDLGDKLSVTAQLMGRGAEDWDLGFEWAFLSYDLTDSVRINAGRLRTPFYKYSDFRDVGYAYDWSRVPQSVYGLGFDNIEGISLYHTTTLGSFDSSLQLIAGSFDDTIRLAGQIADAKIDNITGVTWDLGRDGYNLRAAYLVGKTTFSAEGLNNFMAQLNGFGLADLAAALDVNNEDSSFTGLSFSVDKNNLVFVAEITNAKVDNSFISEQKSWYASLGYRFDSLTPYVSYESEDNNAKREIYAALPTASPLYAPVAGLVESMALDRRSWNLGLRYDFHPSAALKVQYSSADNKTEDRDDQAIVVGVDLVF